MDAEDHCNLEYCLNTVKISAHLLCLSSIEKSGVVKPAIAGGTTFISV